MLNRLLLPALLAALLSVVPALPAHADKDPLDEAKSLVELGNALIEAGMDMGDPDRVREGVKKFRAAKRQFEEALKAPGIDEAAKNRIRAYLVDVESRIDWYSDEAGKAAPAGPESGKGVASGEVRTPDVNKGERLGPWCRRVRKLYDKTDEPLGRAALARGMASKGGVLALPALYDLFEKETRAEPREGIHEALAMVGTWRVANRMASYASKTKEKHWDNALEVIYLCLGKPEKDERERPYMRAIRSFHKLKIRRLTLQILQHLDAMGPPGTAALGEVIYVKDFGYHDYTIGLLSNKKDTRAVPPLVYKMNRFKFHYRVQMPAHKALLKMGWYAVPELVNRLNNKAAGIWISWTLRKITGETMGTDKRKWGDWWKSEKIRHPELFDDPEERPPVVTGGK